MRYGLSSIIKEKSNFMIKWLVMKSNEKGLPINHPNPVIANDDGTWEIDRSIAHRLTSYDFYSNVSSALIKSHTISDFENLLNELFRLSGERRVMLDHTILTQPDNVFSDNLSRRKNDMQTRNVLVSDLTQMPDEENPSKNRIWLAAHVAIIEVMLRAHIAQIVTHNKLVNALSTVIGCRADSTSLEVLSGADGALFWLVTVAARTATLLGIKDCSEWLKVHLLDQPGPTDSAVETNTSDSPEENADRFLRGLAVANLLSLALHFYRPEMATVEKFNLSFGPDWQLEPSASQHNARMVAQLCQSHDELGIFIALMPIGCTGRWTASSGQKQPYSDLDHLELSWFCSQGLARSGAHRRLHSATLAAELFQWLTHEPPDRQIPPIRPRNLNLMHSSNGWKGNTDAEAQCKSNRLLIPQEFDASVLVGSPSANHQGNTVTGQDTYRLDDTVLVNGSHGCPSGDAGDGHHLVTAQSQGGDCSQLTDPKTKSSESENRSKARPRCIITWPNENSAHQLLKEENITEIRIRPAQVAESSGKTESSSAKPIIAQSCKLIAPVEATSTLSNTTNPSISSELLVDECVRFTTPVHENGWSTKYKSVRIGSASCKGGMEWEVGSEVIFGYEGHKPALRSHGIEESIHIKHSERSCQSSDKKYRHRDRIDGRHVREFGVRCNSLIEAGSRPQARPFHYTTMYSESSRGTDTEYESESSVDKKRNSNEGKVLHCTLLKKSPHSSRARQREHKIRASSVHPKTRSNSHADLSTHGRTTPALCGNLPVKCEHCLLPVLCSLNSTSQPALQLQSGDLRSRPISFYTQVHSAWVHHAPIIPTHFRSDDQGPFYLNKNSSYTELNQLGCACLTDPPLHPIQRSLTRTPVNVSDEKTLAEFELKTEVPKVTSSPAKSVTFPDIAQTNTTMDECTQTPEVHEDTSKSGTSSHKASSFFIPFKSDGRRYPNTEFRTLPKARSFNTYPCSTEKQKDHETTSTAEQRKELSPRRGQECDSNEPTENKTVPINLNQLTGHLSMRTEGTNDESFVVQPSSYPAAATSTDPPSWSRRNSIQNRRTNTNNQAERREHKHQLEKERREMIFQDYLNRKLSLSDEKDSENGNLDHRPSLLRGSNGIPSSASSGVVETKSKNVFLRARTAPCDRRATFRIQRPKPNHLVSRNKDEPQAPDNRKLQVGAAPREASCDTPHTPMENTEPKLFVPLHGRSNRRVIANAISHCCLPGPVNLDIRCSVLESLGCTDGRHFIILLRSQCQYCALYNYAVTEDIANRVCGLGPRKIFSDMVDRFYKYDSGSKRFVEISSTSHLSTVVDAIILKGRTKNKYSPNPLRC
ncbi:unnamed protein product [Dicrocoelium dendriticum]|nr:unnamed protein product [Dicrocoelium dendriticum]